MRGHGLSEESQVSNGAGSAECSSKGFPCIGLHPSCVLSLLPQMKIEVILHIQTPVSPAVQMLGQNCWAQEFGAGLTI